MAIRYGQDFNANIGCLEDFADNPFFAQIYEDQSRFVLSFEMSFLADVFSNCMDGHLTYDLFKTLLVSDYGHNKSAYFLPRSLARGS